MPEATIIIVVVGVFAFAFIATMVKGILEVHEQHMAREKMRMTGLGLEAKIVEEERRKQESEADRKRVERCAKLRKEAMSQLDELRKRVPARDKDEETSSEYWQGVEDGVKGALVVLGHAESQRWENEKRVREMLDTVGYVRKEEEETDA